MPSDCPLDAMEMDVVGILDDEALDALAELLILLDEEEQEAGSHE